MLKSLVSSIIILTQSPQVDPEFARLQESLESYGFQVNIAVPPEYRAIEQNGFRRTVRKPYGLVDSKTKTVWIHPIVFELGISRPTIIHETVHAAQYCAGQGKLQILNLDRQPIPQALPFFKRYVNTQRQDLEREAYTVQTQPDSYTLASSLLDRHCQ